MNANANRGARRTRWCRRAATKTPVVPPPAVPRAALTAYGEMLCGALVGLVAGAVLAAPLAAAGGLIVAAALAGFCAGAVIGLVLWSGSADLPEDPVIPPHPSQRRERPAASG